MNNDILEKARRIRNGETQNSEEVSNRVQAAHDLLNSIKDQTVHNRNAHIADLIRQREQKESIARGQAMIDTQKARDAQAEARNAHTASNLDLAHGILPATSNAQAFANQNGRSSLDDAVDQIAGNNVLSQQGKVNRIGEEVQNRFGNQIEPEINDKYDLSRAIRSEVSQNRQTNTAINNAIERYVDRQERQKRIEEAQQKDDPRRRASLENIIQTKKRENDQKIWELELERDQVASTPEQRKTYDDQIEAIKNDANYAELQNRLNDLYDAQYTALLAKPDFKEKSVFNPENASVTDKRINGIKPEEFDPLNEMADRHLDFATEDERDTYNYLRNTRGQSEADKYLSHILPDLEARSMKDITGKVSDFAYKYPWLTDPITTFVSPTQGAGAIGPYLGKLVGDDVRPNAVYNLPTQAIAAAREGSAKRNQDDISGFLTKDKKVFGIEIPGMKKETADTLSNIFTFLKQGYQSAADSAWAAALAQNLVGTIGGIGFQDARQITEFAKNAPDVVDPAVLKKAEGIVNGAEDLTRVIMGMEAVPGAIMSAKERGLDDDQALTLGAIAGFAEFASEKWSVSNLFESNWTKPTVMQWLKQALVQGGFEGLEEVESGVINEIADVIIAHDKSEFRQAMSQYMDNGESENAAFGHALLDFALETGKEALSAGLSAGGSVVFESGKQYIANPQTVHNRVASADRKNNSAVAQTVDTALADLINRPDTEWASGLADIANQFRGTVKGNTMNSVRDYIRETARNQADAVDKAAYTALADYLTPYTNQDGKKVDNRNAVWQLAEERNGTAKQTAQNTQTETAELSTEPSTAEAAPSTESTTATATQQTQSEQAVSVEQQTAPEAQTLTQAQAAPQNASQTSENAPVAENAVEAENNTVAENEAQRGSTEARDDGRSTFLRALNVSEEATDAEIARSLLNSVDRRKFSNRFAGLKNTAASNMSDTLNEMRRSGQYTPEQIEAARQTAVAVDRELLNMTSEAGVQKLVNAGNAALKKAGINAKIVVDNVAARDYKGDVVARGSYKDSDGTIHISPYLDTNEAIYGVIAHEMFHKAADGSERAQLVDDILAARNAILDASDSRRYGISRATRSVIGNASMGDFVESYADLLMHDFGMTDEGMSALQNKLNANPGMDTDTALKQLCNENEEAFWGMWHDNKNLGTAQNYMKEEVAAHFFEELGSQHGEAIMRELMRNDRNLFERIIDAVRRYFHRNDPDYERNETYNRIMNAYERIAAEESGLDARKLNGTAAQKAEIAESTLMTDGNGDPVMQYSLDSLMEPLHLTFQKDEDGVTQLLDSDNNPIKELTAQDVMDSDYGVIIQNNVKDGIITKEEGRKEAQFLADTVNLILKTQDVDMIWAVNSTIGFQPIQPGERGDNTFDAKKGDKDEVQSKFAGFTANSDPQYSTTVDFTTICKKTQQVIDTMSRIMKEKKSGLTQDEIINIVYDEVAKAGEPVPCPVCYVFARWVGLGGLFDNMYQWQEVDYPRSMDTSKIREDIARLGRQIDGLINQKLSDKQKQEALAEEVTDEEAEAEPDKKTPFGKMKNKLAKELAKERKLLEIKQMKHDIQGTEALTAEEQAEFDRLTEQINYLDRWTWLTNVRLRDDYNEHGYVPSDILFDINAGKVFAEQYAPAWAYRTSRGPSMGKAATPYAAEHLGQIITGIAKPSTVSGHTLGNLNKDVFLGTNGQSNQDVEDTLKAARENAKKQNLLNGQRLQSTSDFRYEYALDYLMALFELQAAEAKAQMYTKVPEMVAMAASCGVEINLSLMPLGNGYVIENGKKKLAFSDVTGMFWEDAKLLSSMYDNVQPIMVGINHDHIRLCMREDWISFIIPYHSSGGSEGRYVAMMKAVGEEVTNRTDYSDYQKDFKIKDATPEQIAAREARKMIVTGKASEMTDEQKNAVRNNAILSQLHIRFYGTDVDGNEARVDDKYLNAKDKGTGRDSDTLGVFLSPAQAETVMPYEFWDKTVTLQNAQQNGKLFTEYCEALGLHPRFSGWDKNGKYHKDYDFTTEAGYWKVLPDRSMYNHVVGTSQYGTYHEQKPVNISHLQEDYLASNRSETDSNVEGDTPGMKAARAYLGGRIRNENGEFVRDNDPNIKKPSADNDPTKTADIAAKSIARIEAERAKQNRSYKEQQFDLIQSSVTDENESWIHSPEDILTFGEAVEESGGADTDMAPDFKASAVQKALETGKVRIYSPTKFNPKDPSTFGTFVTTSQAAAKEQMGKGKPSSRMVPLQDVAWVDALQGQYAPLGVTPPTAPKEIDTNITNAVRDNAEETTRQSRLVTPEDDAEYMEAVESGDTEKQQRMVDDAAKEAGYTVRKWHQTNVPNIHVFDLGIGIHGGTDSETPYGVFTKSTNRDIGLGNVQMQLLLKAGKTFTINNREELRSKMPEAYKLLAQELEAVDAKYESLAQEAEDALFEAQDAYEEKHPDVEISIEDIVNNRTYDDPDCQKANERWKAVMAEWREEADKIRVRAKGVLTDYLKANNYDSMEIKLDRGSNGRSTDTFIVLSPEQVKSADPVAYDNDGNPIPLSERFNSENDDIRYSREVGNIAELDDDYNAYNRTALLKEDTVDRYLKDYAAKSSPNYAQAYITRMSPKQFLSLTSTERGESVVRSQTEPMRGEELADAVRQQPIRIRIEDGEVVGHEGRHRMVAMERNGINSVPVLVFDSSNKNSKSEMPSMALMPQEFGDERRSGVQTLKNLIPLSYANRDRIVSEYGTQPTLERMQEKYNGKQTMRFSREMDNEYMDAVESGDEETQNRIIDEAAKAAGYNYRGYHGTNRKFTTFIPGYATGWGKGIYVASNMEDAENYGRNVMPVYLKMDNPYTGQKIKAEDTQAYKKYVEDYYKKIARNEDITVEEAMQDRQKPTVMDMVNDEDVNYLNAALRELGYDGIIMEGSNDITGTEMVVFDPSQVKSADPVTYDDDGNVIPPSQRFNPESEDIRESRMLKSESDYEQALAEEREKRDFLTKQFVGKNSFGYAKALDKTKHDAIVKRYTDLFGEDIPADEINRVIREFERIMERPKRDANDTAEARMEEAWSYLEQQVRGWVERTSYENVLKETIGDESTLEGLVALRTALRDPDDPGYYYIKPDMVTAAGSNDAWNETRRQLNGVKLKGFATQAEAEASGRKPISELWSKLTTDGGAYNGLFTANKNATDYEKLSEIAGMYSLSKETESPYERRALGEYDNTGEVNAIVNDIMYAWEEAAEITKMGKAMQKADERFEASYDRLRRSYERKLDRASERYEKLQNRIKGKDIKRAQRMVLGRIAKDISALDKLQNHPSKDKNKYIPQRLLGTVAKVREAVQNFANRSGKTIDPARLTELQQSAMDETQNFMEGLGQGLKGVGSATEANARQDPNITDVFIRQADNLIQQLRDLRADIEENHPARPTVDENGKRITPTSEMIAEDNAREEAMYEYFNTVRQLLDMTLQAIRNEGKMILNGRTQDLREVSQLLASDLKQHRQKDVSLRHRNLGDETGNWFHTGTFGLMSADAALQRLGDNWHSFIARSVREGQNRQMKHEADFSDFMRKTIGNYDITKGGFYGDYVTLERPTGKVDKNGKPIIESFNVTRNELMSLYALWNRPAGRLHLENGGGTFINQNGQAFHDNNVVLTDELVKEYTDHLTDQEKEIVDKVVDYLSHEASKWGNDVSMYVYGYRLFNEDSYFPMEVADYANKRSFADPTMPGSGLNPGFTQALTRSRKPLAIRDFFDVVNDHIIGMANYNAYGAAAHDLDRILNSSLKDGEKETSMLELLRKTYGNSAVNYLTGFVQKLAGTKHNDPSILDTLRTMGYLSGNLYKRAAVSWNLSTAAKQPLSIIRAANEIDPKYLIFRKPMSPAEYRAAKEKMESLSGIAKIKSLGYSDTGHAKSLQATYDDKYFSDSNFIRRGLGSNKAARGAFQFSDKFTEAGMYLAGKADEMTWVNIWDAVTHEVMDKYPNLAGDELDAKITERFNEVIGLTQVVDSILDSAPVLQEKVFSLAFPFMNEPVKSASNLILAASKFNQPGGKKKFAKAMGLQLLSAVLLEPLVTTLASMWRDEKDDIGNGFWDHFLEKMFGIKKDEDGFSSTDLESITTSNAFAGIWSMPFITQLYDTYSNAVQDYDNTSIDKAAAVDLVKAFQNLHKYNGASNEKSAKTQNRLWREFAESFASVLGVPAKTIRREISGTARLFMNWAGADELKWEYNKISYNLENSNARSQKGFYDILAHAYATGDMETYEKFRKELNDIVTDNSTLVDVNTIIKNIEKRGGNVQPGDPLWNVEVQARFRLDTPVKGWKNENFLTGVYKQAESAGIKDDECKKVLYSLPDKYEYEDEDGDDIEMSPSEYDQFASDCGDLAYKLVSQLSSTSNAKAWSALTIDQQLYAIEKAYDYSKRKFRKDINPELNITGMGKKLVAVYETAPMDTSKIIAAVMDMAAGYKGEKDRKKK